MARHAAAASRGGQWHCSNWPAHVPTTTVGACTLQRLHLQVRGCLATPPVQGISVRTLASCRSMLPDHAADARRQKPRNGVQHRSAPTARFRPPKAEPWGAPWPARSPPIRDRVLTCALNVWVCTKVSVPGPWWRRNRCAKVRNRSGRGRPHEQCTCKCQPPAHHAHGFAEHFIQTGVARCGGATLRRTARHPTPHNGICARLGSWALCGKNVILRRGVQTHTGWSPHDHEASEPSSAHRASASGVHTRKGNMRGATTPRSQV